MTLLVMMMRWCVVEIFAADNVLLCSFNGEKKFEPIVLTGEQIPLLAPSLTLNSFAFILGNAVLLCVYKDSCMCLLSCLMMMWCIYEQMYE